MSKLLVLFLLVVGYNSYSQKPPLVQKFKERGPVMMWANSPQDTVGLLDAYIPTQQDSYLTKAGKLKNLSLTILGITSSTSALILTQPSNTIAEYNNKARIAGLVSLLGGGISLGLQIKSNNMLIKAGLATQP